MIALSFENRMFLTRQYTLPEHQTIVTLKPGQRVTFETLGGTATGILVEGEVSVKDLVITIVKVEPTIADLVWEVGG